MSSKSRSAQLTVARRYAKALFDLALEAGNVDDVLKELNFFLGLFLESHLLKKVLADQEVSTAAKLKVIKEICNLTKASSIMSNTIMLLVEKGRFDLFVKIHDLYRKMSESYAKIERVEAQIAFASLAPAFKKMVEETLSDLLKKRAVCDIKINKELLGGATVKIGDAMLDASVIGKLSRMETELL